MARGEDGIRGTGNSMRMDMAISSSFERYRESGEVKTIGPGALLRSWHFYLEGNGELWKDSE